MTRTVLLDLTPLDTPSRHRGIGRYVRQLAVGLSRVGGLGDLRLLGLTRLEMNGDFELTEDLASWNGSSKLPWPDARDHYRFAYARRAALFRAVRRIGCGAVHLGDPNATPLFMGLTNCSRIVTCHDLIGLLFPDRYLTIRDGGPFIGRHIARRRYRSADLVVAISDATRRDLIALAGISDSRVVRVYNGIDGDVWARGQEEDPQAVARRHGLRGPFVIYVGGADWRKNAEGMMGAIAWARDHAISFDLAWAGKLKEREAQPIRELAQRSGLAGQVRLLDFVPDDDLRSLYRAAIAHLFVSRAEGFGFTVVEAMSAGCPVVTTLAGSLSEVAGDAAIAVDPEDHPAIGRALVRLATDRELRESLIARGKKRAAQFSVEAQARAMIEVYRGAVERDG